MKYDCPYCEQSLEKAAEDWAKWRWVGPGERPRPRCPGCGGPIAQRIYLEEISAFLAFAIAVLTAFWWLDGKPPMAILAAILGVVAVTIPLAGWLDKRLRNAQRYKRGNAI